MYKADAAYGTALAAALGYKVAAGADACAGAKRGNIALMGAIVDGPFRFSSCASR